MADALGGLGAALPSMGTIMGFVTPLLVLLFLGIIAYILYATGILFPRPLTAIIRVPRLGGGIETYIAKARKLKDGKLELAYSTFNIVKVNAPRDDQIQYGKFIEGSSKSKNEVDWFNDVHIDSSNLTLTAAISESAELMYATNFAMMWDRTHKPNKLLELAGPAAFIIAALIIFAGIYLFGQMFNAGAQAQAASINGFTHTLDNATIYVYKNAPANPAIPPNQASNAPPG